MKRPTPSPAARAVAIIMIGAGFLLTVASYFADDLNLTRGGDGLGWLQLIGVIVGLTVLLLGLAWLLQPARRRNVD